MEIEIFEVQPGAYGYRVGNVFQEWHPDYPGYIPMSKEEAEVLANAVKTRLEQ